MPASASPDRHQAAETRRLATLHALDLLDSDPQAELDSLVTLAAGMLACPTAALTLVDRDRQWMLSRSDDGARQTPRDISFCTHVVDGDAAMVIDDATADPRFATSPLVTEDGIRFYAGVPVHAIGADGSRQPIGALCVVDRAPRSLSSVGRETLMHFARLAEALIAARGVALEALKVAATSERLTEELLRRDRMFDQAERMAQFGSWTLTLADETLTWSDGTHRIHAVPVEQAPDLASALDFYPPESRARISAAVADAIEHQRPFDLELDFVSATGERKRVRSIGAVEIRDGITEQLYGVFQDISERRAVEERLRRAADEDPLTGIANRAAFDRALEAAMRRSERDGTPLLVAIVDLDGFKAINDTLGHRAGDDTLCAVARRLGAPWLKGSVAGRIGGDEFALFFEDPALCASPDALASRLEEELRLPIHANGLTIQSGGSIGIARHGPDTPTVRDVLHEADKALYVVKNARVGRRRRAA